MAASTVGVEAEDITANGAVDRCSQSVTKVVEAAVAAGLPREASRRRREHAPAAGICWRLTSWATVATRQEHPTPPPNSFRDKFATCRKTS